MVENCLNVLMAIEYIPIFSFAILWKQLIFLGTPSAADWPEESSLLRNSFAHSRPQDLASLLPEMDTEAKDLLQVWTHLSTITHPR